MRNGISRGFKLNSFFVFIRTFKTLLNNAIKEGIVPENYNPFKGYDFKKFRGVKTQKRALSEQELMQFIEYKVSESDACHDFKNYFLFSLYCKRINFIDMAYLTWGDINDDRLEYKRKKTNERFTMKLLEPASAIIDYYKAKNYSGQGSYVFPILNDFHKTPQQKENRIDKILKKTNKELKQIAEKAGIQGKVTTYVARHSFATTLKRKGVPTGVISEMMGHDNEKTTAIYLAEFENTALDEAAKLLL